jgi:prepilin-type N-terminal cleavage/methylation domain-containing protein
MRQVRTTKKQRGFTLIELSIVLVIIGLIVGGVLVGQDLIKAAEVRATVGQYEKYNSAINTFRTKYNGMPGDLVSTQAVAFGLFSNGMDGTTGKGDGNGLLTDTGSTAAQIGEPLVFWRHLSDASLIDGNYGASLAAAGATAADTTGSTIGTYIPGAKIGRGNYWVVGASSGLNYYMLSGFGATGITTAGVITFAKALTPIESYNIDVKVDDGLPNTGTVQARGTATDKTLFNALVTANGSVSHTAGSEAAGDCTVGSALTATTATYSRIAVSGNSPGCSLRMRFN